MATLYGFTKRYKNPRTPPRTFLYATKARRDAGVKLARPGKGSKLPPALKSITKFKEKVRT